MIFADYMKLFVFSFNPLNFISYTFKLPYYYFSGIHTGFLIVLKSIFKISNKFFCNNS